jgi:hypothetical protein
MGQVSTEQTVAIIEAVGEAIKTDTVIHPEPNMAFWPLLIIAIVPVILAPFVAMWFKKRKKK